jgi:hypothetical protein
MFRSLLVFLAVLVPGLAFLFDRPWLYVLTGAILASLLGLVGWWLWTTYGKEEPDRPRPTLEPDEPDMALDDLGIVDIKPEGADESPSHEAAAPEEEPTREPAESAQDAPAPSAPNASGRALATKAPSTDAEQSETSQPDAAPQPEPSADSAEAPVFAPLLESVRAALDARTVCLLVQEEVALTYRIEALASTHPSVRPSGTFDTQTPLLTATMSRESVTVRPLATEEIAIEDLRYYEDPPPVNHLALAPVSQPDASSTTFLLADAPETTDLGTSRARTLLKHYAETVALLLDTGRSAPERTEAEDADASSGGASPQDTPETGAVEGDLNGNGAERPRPRRELIAEEMKAAQSNSETLALALVHLNRAESIARRGEEAVASAEHLFEARLDQLMPAQRIERFGELTYGIFFREGADAVEPQVAELKARMAQEEGELEGGVSVGAAVWDEEDPEALRTEATEALREAYETGTPTIVT